MANEINGLPGPSIHDALGTRKTDKTPETGVDASQQDASKTTAPQDSVSLTESAKLLHKLESRLEEVPAVNNDRVNAIKQAIANGDYKVDPERIARKLLQLDSQLP